MVLILTKTMFPKLAHNKHSVVFNLDLDVISFEVARSCLIVAPRVSKNRIGARTFSNHAPVLLKFHGPHFFV